MDRQPELIPFRSCRDEGWSEAWEIYEHAFPDCERWREEAYARALGDPLFEADAIRLDGKTVGLLFHWRTERFRYIEHLAVTPALRGRHIGAAVLQRFCAEVREPVILEIDPPEDELSVRRRGFYERQGFVMNPYEYIHPSFRRPFRAHRLMLMSYPRVISRDEARRFADFVREEVLRYSDHEHPELPRLQ